MSTAHDPPGLLDLVGAADATLCELFAARAAATPMAPFLRWGDTSWSYREALMEIGRFSDWAHTTVGSKSRIASYTANRPEALWAWLGTLWSGNVFVPLNRALRGGLLGDMLVRSGAEVLVTDVAASHELPDLPSSSVRTLVALGDGDTRSERCWTRWRNITAEKLPPAAAAGPDDVAEVMFTSGTTGRSKAVLLSHNQLARGAGWVSHVVGMTPRDVVHAWLPIFHVAGQLDVVLATVVGGGTVALHPRFSLSRFWDEVAADGATIFTGFTNVLQLLWGLPGGPEDEAHGLRAGMVGGVPPSLRRPFERRFGVTLFDSYGMTEANPLTLPTASDPDGSVGRASPDFEIATLGPDDEQVGASELGSICVRPRRPHVMFAGYEGDDPNTAAATGSRWFRTGDLGRIDEQGFVYFADRDKHAIRRRGENISSWELEQEINGHRAVRECAALGVPAQLGEEDVMVVVAREPHMRLDPAELYRWCGTRMAAFMVPRFIVIVDELPSLETGKIAKEALRAYIERAWDATCVDVCARNTNDMSSTHGEAHR